MLFLMVLIAAPIVAFILIKLIMAAVRFKNKAQYISMELHRAYENDEYFFWKKELRCHYLRLLPFVTEKNVEFFYDRLFHAETARRSDGVFHMLAPSFVGIIICAICLCGASWAWFTAADSSSVSPITAATFAVKVTAKSGDENVELTEKPNGIFEFKTKKSGDYIIALKAEGTASTGYAVVFLNEEKHYTEQLSPERTLTFTVTADKDTTVTVEPQWGTCAVTTEKITQNTHLTATEKDAEASTPDKQTEKNEPTAPAEALNSDNPTETTKATSSTEPTGPTEPTETPEPTEATEPSETETTENATNVALMNNE